MKTQKILMVGFDFMENMLFGPCIKEWLNPDVTIVCQNLADVYRQDEAGCIDFIVLHGCCVGFEIEKELRKLTDAYPEARFIVLSLHTLSPLIGMRFLKGGVDILFWNIKDAHERKRVLSAIENGRRYMPAEVRIALDTGFPPDGAGVMRLSEKERQAVYLTVRGHSLKQISRKMGIATGTAASMRSKYLQKMGVNSVQQLVSRSIQMNLFRISGDEN